MLHLIVFYLTFSQLFSRLAATELTERAKDLEVIIKENKKKAPLPFADIALQRLPFLQQIQTAYGDFGAAVEYTQPDCKSEPDELLTTYYLPVKKTNFPQFLESAFVKNLPKNAIQKLELLEMMDGKTTLSDSFSKLFSDKGVDTFEIGHFVIKAYFTETHIHVLIFGPSLKTSIGSKEDCTFSSDFRKEFINKSQDVQSMLAIKAAENTAFIDTIASFETSNPDTWTADWMKSKGFIEIATSTGETIYKLLTK